MVFTPFSFASWVVDPISISYKIYVDIDKIVSTKVFGISKQIRRSFKKFDDLEMSILVGLESRDQTLRSSRRSRSGV